jgi:hypothetical protein
VTPLEDDVRDRFAAIAAPDVPAPAMTLLRTRAHRIRTTRIVASAASFALVAVGIGVGTVALSHRHGQAEFANGVTAIPAHVDGVPTDAQQWQVANERVDGKDEVAAVWLVGSKPCVSYRGGGWCHADGEVSDVADFGTTGGSGMVSIAGSVPATARTVVVHYGRATHTVRAVLTPTTSRMRFFATFFRATPDDQSYQPELGVFDSSGHPVPPPVRPAAPSTANTRSHVAKLPAAQWGYAFSDQGWTAIAYRMADGATCATVAGAPSGVLAGTHCATAAPTAARILARIPLGPDHVLLLGDAPVWVRDLVQWGPTGMSSVTATRTPAASDRLFWALDYIAGGANWSLLASCAAGHNCVAVTDLAKMLAAG